MNKEKLKFLPFNLIFCLSSLFVPLTLLSTFTPIDFWLSFGISFYLYLMDVRLSSDNDYLLQKIKNLEDTQLKNL